MITSIPLTALQPVNYRMPARMEPNPYDRATIFSVYPRTIVDTQKVTLQPNTFTIIGGTLENPGRTPISPATWWRDVDPEEPLMEMPVPAVQLADSIVRDYCNSRLGSSMGDARPGIFYLPGDVSVETLIKDYPHMLKTAVQKQKDWYTILVKLGDALWARTNANPLTIDDGMRLAAKELGMSRPWIENFKSLEMVPCVACGNMRNPNFPICSVCKAVVDVKKAEALGIVFAK